MPFAHLNFILFDENFNYLDGGFDKVSSAAATQHETLTLDITIPQRGYLFVYVSNESEWDVRTYFDELVIDHEHLDVIQHDDYYPFGLAHNQNAQQERSNKYLYQGKERQFDLGLGWDDFHARQYDAALGRWHVMDPAGQFHSPYLAMGNNPVSFVDPDGEFAHILIGAAIGGVINLGIKAFQGKIDSPLDAAVAFGIGAAAGAVGAATGGAAFLAAGGGAAGAGGFAAGFVGGAVGSAFASPIQAIGNTAYFGDPMMTPGEYGLSILGGGLLGGAINGGIALFNGKGFLTGNPLQGNGPVGQPQITKLDVPKTSEYSLPRSQLKPLPGQRIIESADDNLLSGKINLRGDFTHTTITSQRFYLNPGLQGRHIVGHNNYLPGRSILTANPDELVNALNSGNFTPAGVSNGGMPVVKFNQIIGEAVNKFGVSLGTTEYGIIHIGKGGIHIVPWLP